MRLTIETRERQGINLHLLVYPDDPDHVSRAEEKLAQLCFRYRDDGMSEPMMDSGDSGVHIAKTHPYRIKQQLRKGRTNWRSN